VRSVEDLDTVFSLCMHVSQNIAFGGTTTELVKMWDFRMPDPCLCVLHAHNDVVSSISCSPNGKLPGSL
jgi:WD40 repeat protein